MTFKFSYQVSVAQSAQWNDEFGPDWIDVVVDVLGAMNNYKSQLYHYI